MQSPDLKSDANPPPLPLDPLHQLTLDDDNEEDDDETEAMLMDKSTINDDDSVKESQIVPAQIPYSGRLLTCELRVEYECDIVNGDVTTYSRVASLLLHVIVIPAVTIGLLPMHFARKLQLTGRSYPPRPTRRS